MRYLLITMIHLALIGTAFGQTTESEQTAVSPDEALAELLEGNAHFVNGKTSDPEIRTRRENSAQGQYPKAVVLSCLDSRVPVELVFDQGIGDIFVGRVAGNVADKNQLGSMEFATKLAGAKLVLVLGHTSCGAVRGACDGAQMGNLTALLAKIKPAVDSVEGFDLEQRNSANAEFVARVTEENVRKAVSNIREHSEVLAALETSGQIKIVGAMYDLQTGKVALLE